jgi:LPXTG-motif cell wall-anchored protein
MRMSRRSLMVPALVALVSFGLSAGPASAQQAVTVALSPQNASGISGEVTLTPMGQQTKVSMKLTGAGAGPEPAHIHAGTCATLDPRPAFPLTSVANGASETTVDAPLSQLQGSQMAINVHKSPQEASVYVACGNIPALVSVGGPQPPVAQPAPSPSPSPAPAIAPSSPPAPTASPAPAQARPPAQLPRTGESDFALYGFLALGALLTLAGLGLAVRRAR